MERRHQVELGGAGVERQGVEDEISQLEGDRRVLERAQDLDERRPAALPAGRQLLHQALERQVLALEGVQRGPPGALERLVEARRAGEVRPQHQGVDEEADQRLDLGTGPVGDRRADRQVPLAGMTGEDHLERRQQHHERRRLPRPGELRHAVGHVPTERQGNGAPALAPRRRPRPVGRQLEGRQPGEAVAPGREQAIQHLPPKPTALPEGEVRVLDGQRRERRRLAVRERPVERRELVQEDAGRPAVGDDVVHGRRQHVALRAGGQQQGPQQRPALQVERAARLPPQQPRRLGLGPVGGKRGQVDPGQRSRTGVVHHLDGGAVRPLGEGGPQRLVATRHLGQRLGEGGRVDPALEPRRRRHVVGHPAVEPVEQPESLLGEGERQVLRALRGSDPVRGDGSALGVLVGDGVVRATGCETGRPTGVRERLLESPGQAADGPPLEQAPQRDLDAGRLPQPGDHAGREERLAPQVEEVVLHRQAVGARQVERLGEGPRHRPLRRGPRRQVGVRAGRPLRALHVPDLPRGPGGQGAPIELAAGGLGQRVDRHDPGGHQGLGQPVPQVLRQRGWGEVAGAVGRDDEGDQHPRRADAPGDDGDSGHRRVGEQSRLHLARLDPEPAHLELLVEAPEVLDRAVGQEAGAVAGAVEALPDRFGGGVRDEALRGQRRAAQVAPRHLGTGDHQLAGHADRLGAERPVDHQQAGVGRRPADRHPAARRRHRGTERHVDRRLGGAVLVVQRHRPRARPPAPALRQVRPQGVAAGEGPAQAVRDLAVGPLEVRLEQRRHEVDRGHPLAGELAGQRRRIALGLRVGEHDPRAEGERGRQLPDREVEAEGRLGDHRLVRVQPEVRLHPGEPVDHRRVAVGHPLRPAGGAGGVDHVRGALGRQARRARGLGGRPGSAALEQGVDRHATLAGDRQLRDRALEPGAGHHHVQPGVFYHPAQPLRRVRGVEGQPGAAGREHGQEGHDRLRRAVQQAAHRHLGTDAQGPQPRRHRPGPAHQLAIAERAAAPGEGHGIRPVEGARGDQLVESARRDLQAPPRRPLDGDLVTFGRVEHGQGVDRGVRRRHGGGHEPFQAAHEAAGGRVVEQGAVDLQGAGVASAVGRAQRQAQVELGRAGVDQLRDRPQTRQGEAAVRGVLEDEQRLDQGGRAEGSLRAQGLDQPVERHLLVREGAEGPPAHPPDEIPEGGLPFQVGAHHDRVDEQPDEGLRGDVVAVGHRASDAEVVLSGEAAEEDLERRRQHHERGRVEGRRETAQQITGPAFEDDCVAPAGPGAVPPARPVGGQLERRETVELVEPEAGRGLEPSLRRPAPLGRREVRDLERQGHQPGGRLVAAGPVEGGEVPHQDPQRPAVGDDVVEGDDQGLATGFRPQQGGVEQWTARQVERPPHQPPDQAIPLTGEAGACEPLEIDDRESAPGLPADHLARSLGRVAKGGPQALVPPDQRDEGGGEPGALQGTVEGDGAGHGVGGRGGIQAIDQPQPPLGERQGGVGWSGAAAGLRRRAARARWRRDPGPPVRRRLRSGPLEPTDQEIQTFTGQIGRRRGLAHRFAPPRLHESEQDRCSGVRERSPKAQDAHRTGPSVRRKTTITCSFAAVAEDPLPQDSASSIVQSTAKE